MRYRWIVAPLVLVLSLTMPLEARGPRWGRGGGWTSGEGYGRIYDPSTETTVAGTIRAFETMRPERGMSPGLHLVLEVGDQVLPVHLGPKWYMERQALPLSVGDHITVRGSLVALEGEDVLIAARVFRDEDVLELRDETGRPYWAGWRSVHAGSERWPRGAMP